MAKRATITYIDDYDGQDIAEGDHHLAEFAWEGKRYEMDLSGKNYELLESLLKPFIENATPVGKPATTYKRIKRDPAQVKAIREWARSKGYEISDRGRIPVEIENAYNEARAA